MLFWLTFSVHMLVSPYWIFTLFYIFNVSFNAIVFQSSYCVVDVGQSQITNRTRCFSNQLFHSTGGIFLNGARQIFCFLSQCVFFKCCTSTGAAWTVYNNDFLIRTANFFPVCDFTCEDLYQLIFFRSVTPTLGFATADMATTATW